jgi:hypothetical protein
MNWRRGLFRTWLIATAIWAFVHLWAPAQAQLVATVGWLVGFRVADARSAGYSDSEILAYFCGGVAEVVLIPLSVLLLGAAALWALGGFKRAR